MKYLLISEKPSLMMEVKKVFNKSNFSKYNTVDFIPLHGHCCKLVDPSSYDKKYDNWNKDDLPILPARDYKGYNYIPIENELVDNIKKQIKENNYDGLINCTDPEREGQNIFYSLYQYLKLKLPVLRFWTNDLTEEKLIKAWDSMKDDIKDEDLKNLTLAALLRAQADWDIGMNCSRALGIATGRVMSATLNSILAKREKEIANFKPKDSFDIIAKYKDGFDGKYIDLDKEGNGGVFENEKDAIDFIKKKLIKNEGVIGKCENKKVKQAAPLLYSTAELQADANIKYGYTATETLDIVEKLYNDPNKILTYPRTDCSWISKAQVNEDLEAILDACQCVPELKGISYKLNKETYKKSKYVDDSKVEVHSAITLTGKHFDFDKFSEKEKNIISLVAKRCFATVLPEAEYVDTSIDVVVMDSYIFKTRQKILINPNYLSIYNFEAESGIDFSKLSIGDKLLIKEYEVKKQTTTCPRRYNDASLLKAMVNVGNTLDDKELAKVLRGNGSKDQGGIGTPATRAAIIDKLCQERKAGKDKKEAWVIRKGKMFYVTEFGMKTAAIFDNYTVGSAILTAEWEKKLGDVAKGILNAREFRSQLDDYIISEVNNMKKNSIASYSGSKNVKNTNLKCPFCGEDINESDLYYYCLKYKPNSTRTKNDCGFILAKNTKDKVSISIDELEKLINGECIGPYKFKSSKGNEFEAKLYLDLENKKTAFEFINNDNNVTSNKKDNILMQGKFGPYYATKFGNISQNYFGHKITLKELKSLIAGDELIWEMKSQAGKTYKAKYKLDKNSNKIIRTEYVN